MVLRRAFLANGKPQALRNHRTVSELAEYVGVSARTVERWAANGDIPEPAAVTEQGWKLWSPQQASNILDEQIRKRTRRGN